MKKAILIPFALIMGIALQAQTQTQQGYVKTKGRMIDGRLVPGQGLKGASVSIKGRTAVLVNADDGVFSFPVTESQFRVDSVRKKGYQLVDLDALGKTYRYSANPIYLVMETPDQQLQDQLAAERKIRRTLTRQLHEREDELDSLKKQQRISEEEYREALQKLYEDTDQNEQLVKDMVERYSKIDYDQLSEFDKQISEYILNGELTKADSMLRTKGDINERVALYKQHEAINAKEQAELTERQEQLEQSQALAIQERDDLANDCYRKFEIFKMQHENDSAAYYIELRAELDTTNVEWLNEAGIFLFRYKANIPKSLSYFQLALRQNNLVSEEGDAWKGTIYNNIGLVYSQGLDNYEKALEYYEKALVLEEKTFGENHPDMAGYLNNIGTVFYHQGDFEKALEYFNNALSISEVLPEDRGTIYNNIGSIYYSKYNDFEKGLEYLNKGLFIKENTLGATHPDVADSYNIIGSFFYDQHDFDKALEYLFKALSIREAVLGENHPDVANSCNNIAATYRAQYNFEKAWLYYQKALNITENTTGKHSLDIASYYGNIGTLFFAQGNYEQALEYTNQSLSIRNIFLNESHPDLALCYDQLGNIYANMGDNQEALYYLNKALTIRKAAYGETHNLVARTLNNIARLYYDSGDYESALMYLDQALSIRKQLFGEYHPVTIDQMENISTCKYWIAVKNDTVNAFFKEHCITATVANDETEAAKQGLSGVYVLLEYGDWNQDSPISVFDKMKELTGKPKDIVVIKDGLIEKHHFENTVGVVLSAKYIGKEERQNINEAYEEWKAKSSPKSKPN